MNHYNHRYIRLPIVYYHSIGLRNPDWNRNYLTLDVSQFVYHLQYFIKNYHIIGLRELSEIRMGVKKPQKNALIITFDDGFLDNWIWAYPLLKKYGVKATIFVSPEFVDIRAGVRPNLEDYEKGRANQEEITSEGYLSWEEMKAMEATELIDIQSHTLTHTKLIVSDKIVGFHHPGADVLYTIGNLFPREKPYSLGDKRFERLIPYGYPLFEEKSAVIARKVTINPDFLNECTDALRGYDFVNYKFIEVMAQVRPIYNVYRSKDNLIIGRESEMEYSQRVDMEIGGSKKIIEEKLAKKIEYLCWPHGDNNEELHKKALEMGYVMTTQGKVPLIEKSKETRIPERIGANFSTLRRKIKTVHKLKALAGKFPQYLLFKIYRKI